MTFAPVTARACNAAVMHPLTIMKCDLSFYRPAPQSNYETFHARWQTLSSQFLCVGCLAFLLYSLSHRCISLQCARYFQHDCWRRVGHGGWLKMLDMKMTDQSWRQGAKLQKQLIVARINKTTAYSNRYVWQTFHLRHWHWLVLQYYTHVYPITFYIHLTSDTWLIIAKGGRLKCTHLACRHSWLEQWWNTTIVARVAP